VTVTGAVARPANLRVILGTPLQALADHCGGAVGEAGRAVMGGPMMGIAQADLSAPAIKGTSGLLLLRREETPAEAWNACIGCGRCVGACPMQLVPAYLGTAIEAGFFDRAEAARAADCIECGCCAYVCPAKRPLVHWLKWGKRKIAEARAAAKGKAGAGS
jgi:electron transport complex protein RnfC